VKNEFAGIGLLLVTVTASSAAQEKASTPSTPSCSEADFGTAAKLVQTSRAALLALPIGDGMQTEVSPKGQHAISAMKESLGNFVDAYMRCTP
jgi:hypothetical protein